MEKMKQEEEKKIASLSKQDLKTWSHIEEDDDDEKFVVHDDSSKEDDDSSNNVTSSTTPVIVRYVVSYEVCLI